MIAAVSPRFRFALALFLALLFAFTYVVNIDGVFAPRISAPSGSSVVLHRDGAHPVQNWTSTRTFTAHENAEQHFRKHSRDLGYKTVDDYIAGARAFLHNPPPGTQTVVQKDGDIVRFHADTARFAVMRADGMPRTFFKLNPDIHGYPTNQAYVDAQSP